MIIFLQHIDDDKYEKAVECHNTEGGKLFSRVTTNTTGATQYSYYYISTQYCWGYYTYGTRLY